MGTIPLKQGSNYVLFKIIQYASESWFKFKFTDMSGNPVTNLVYRYDNSPISMLPLTSSTYRVGDKININWTADPTNIDGTMAISLSTDNGRSWSMIAGPITYGQAPYFIGNVGTFSWTVTDTVLLGATKISTRSSQCQIRVYAPYDLDLPQSLSQKFTIAGSAGVLPAKSTAQRQGLDWRVQGSTLLYRANGTEHITIEIHDLLGRAIAVIKPAKSAVSGSYLFPRPGLYLVGVRKGSVYSATTVVAF